MCQHKTSKFYNSQSNLNPQGHHALNTLRNSEIMIIKLADKFGGIVIQEARHLISDQNTYMKLKSDQSITRSTLQIRGIFLPIENFIMYLTFTTSQKVHKKVLIILLDVQ